MDLPTQEKSLNFEEHNSLMTTGDIKEQHSCPNCNYTTDSKQVLESHVPGCTTKPYGCTAAECGYKTQNEDCWEEHMEMHDKGKPYKCVVGDCSYRTFREVNLTIHNRIHTGEKAYGCEVKKCSYRATQTSQLTSHMQTHAGEHLYTCDEENCLYSTVHYSTLKSHKERHSVKKKFQCEKCTYSSSLKVYLDNHMRNDHKDATEAVAEFLE